MPLLLTRPFAVQFVVAIVLPVAFGILTGYLLGVSEVGYAVCSIAGILGGIAAGYDHLGADQGFVRGICGGLLFGVSILLAHSLFDQTAKATLPHPHGVLVAVTTILGAIFGAIGGGLRARREGRATAATA
jgi:Na+/H+ antiporter NhaA